MGSNTAELIPDQPDEMGLWPKGVVPAIAGGWGDLVRVGMKLKDGKGKEKLNCEPEPEPSLQQRDCPLSGVKADIDLTLVLPLRMARKCQEPPWGEQGSKAGVLREQPFVGDKLKGQKRLSPAIRDGACIRATWPSSPNSLHRSRKFKCAKLTYAVARSFGTRAII